MNDDVIDDIMWHYVTTHTYLTTFAFIFFWNKIFLPFSNSSDFYLSKTCVGVFRLTYTRADNESSTWDSTRLRNFVVFVMRSFWQFVSCPATQNATCNIFAADRNFSKIPCNKMQRFQPYRNSQSRYCHTKIHENSWKFKKKNPKISMDAINQEESRRHNNFLTNQRAA